jgi:hypothetical protein
MDAEPAGRDDWLPAGPPRNVIASANFRKNSNETERNQAVSNEFEWI